MLDHDTEQRILLQIASIREDLARAEGGREEALRKLDQLQRTVHEEYAGGPGIGPRTLAMSTPTQPQQQGFWPSILGAIAVPLKAFAAARPFTQLVVLVGFLFAMLVMTEGGRELIAALISRTSDTVVEALAPGPEVDDVTVPEEAPATFAPIDTTLIP